MFTPLGLFRKLPCPLRGECERVHCLYSHDAGVSAPTYAVSYSVPLPAAAPSQPVQRAQKRKEPDSQPPPASSSSGVRPPPTKTQRVGPTKAKTAVPTATETPAQTGPPVLRVNAGASKVPIPTRQAMVTLLYNNFLTLYDQVLAQQPSLASEHAIRQENEIYSRSSKLTYRNAAISVVASINARTKPVTLSHPSVGTQADLAERTARAQSLASHVLTPSQLAPFLLTRDEMHVGGYIVEVPNGPGGTAPSAVGTRVTCDRCRSPYEVRAGPDMRECCFHWGKLLPSTVNGERTRLYTCCSRTQADDGCTRGPHVFYESDPTLLHDRHAFTSSAEYSTAAPNPLAGPPFNVPTPGRSTALDIAALDCEMVYTTGGMRIARVSVVDATGREVLDELIAMDRGVTVVDYNTRFSGLSAASFPSSPASPVSFPYQLAQSAPQSKSKTPLPLASVRRLLAHYVDAHTILIGHGLENDLRALRMIHPLVVDTAALFAHQRGWPFRRALRDLAREHLGRSIQTGGATVGHSSVEDSVAALDLVKWFVVNKKSKPKIDVNAAQKMRRGLAPIAPVLAQAKVVAPPAEQRKPPPVDVSRSPDDVDMRYSPPTSSGTSPISVYMQQTAARPARRSPPASSRRSPPVSARQSPPATAYYTPPTSARPTSSAPTPVTRRSSPPSSRYLTPVDTQAPPRPQPFTREPLFLVDDDEPITHSRSRSRTPPSVPRVSPDPPPPTPVIFASGLSSQLPPTPSMPVVAAPTLRKGHQAPPSTPTSPYLPPY
ncbi:unnamed protein product [Peniophora sp. CBMAI 1063]|nr:unnamed protein product [Peniophora sp. CBMAI 1063]